MASERDLVQSKHSDYLARHANLTEWMQGQSEDIPALLQLQDDILMELNRAGDLADKRLKKQTSMGSVKGIYNRITKQTEKARLEAIDKSNADLTEIFDSYKRRSDDIIAEQARRDGYAPEAYGESSIRWTNEMASTPNLARLSLYPSSMTRDLEQKILANPDSEVGCPALPQVVHEQSQISSLSIDYGLPPPPRNSQRTLSGSGTINKTQASSQVSLQSTTSINSVSSIGDMLPATATVEVTSAHMSNPPANQGHRRTLTTDTIETFQSTGTTGTAGTVRTNDTFGVPMNRSILHPSPAASGSRPTKVKEGSGPGSGSGQLTAGDPEVENIATQLSDTNLDDSASSLHHPTHRDSSSHRVAGGSGSPSAPTIGTDKANRRQ